MIFLIDNIFISFAGVDSYKDNATKKELS